MSAERWAWLGGADVKPCEVLMRWHGCGLAGRVLIDGEPHNARAICTTRGEALAAALAGMRDERERHERRAAVARANERRLRRELARESVATLPGMEG
jgi:hypothetical protein